MNEQFVQGLAIAVIGMGTVFAALLLLWALIAVLGRLKLPGADGAAEDQEVLSELHEDDRTPAPTQDELAAIAAALVLLQAEREAETTLRWRLPPILTRWVAVGYSRQLEPWRPPRNRPCE